MKHILKKYSIFMNKKYDFSKCNFTPILIDKLVKEKLHKDIFLNENEFTNYYLEMNYIQWNELSLFLQRKIYTYYPFLKNCSEEQLICTLVYSSPYIIRKYGGTIAICLIRQLSTLISDVDYKILISFIFMYLQKFISKQVLSKRVTLYIGNALFSSYTFDKYIYNLRGQVNSMQIDLNLLNYNPNVIGSILIFTYFNLLDINLYKSFWNYSYNEFMNKNLQRIKKDTLNLFIEDFNKTFIFQYYFPTLTNEQIENIIFKIIKYSSLDNFYLRFLKHINSSKIDKYKAYQLMQDLRKE